MDDWNKQLADYLSTTNAKQQLPQQTQLFDAIKFRLSLDAIPYIQSGTMA